MRSAMRPWAVGAVAALATFGASGCGDLGEDWPESGRRSTLGEMDVGDLTIAAPATGNRAAMYFRVRNRSGEDDVLLGVSLFGVGSPSLHRTEVEGDVSRMTAQGSVEIPSRRVVDLRPGGFHVMVEGFTGDLREGDSTWVSVDFERAGRVGGFARVLSYAEVAELFAP